jgi:hypothetical protein
MFINMLCSNVNKTLRITTLVMVFVTLSGNFMLLIIKKFRSLKKVGLFLAEWVRGVDQWNFLSPGLVVTLAPVLHTHNRDGIFHINVMLNTLLHEIAQYINFDKNLY